MMPDKSLVERIFGPSYQTSIAGIGTAILALVCIWIGYKIDNSELIVVGVSILGGGQAVVGALARSQKTHEKDKEKGET